MQNNEDSSELDISKNEEYMGFEHEAWVALERGKALGNCQCAYRLAILKANSCFLVESWECYRVCKMQLFAEMTKICDFWLVFDKHEMARQAVLFLLLCRRKEVLWPSLPNEIFAAIVRMIWESRDDNVWAEAEQGLESERDRKRIMKGNGEDSE